MTTSVAAGIVMLAIGGTALAIGAWSVATSRRPPWLGAKTIPESTVRMWGAGTALAGGGVAIVGFDQMALSNTGLGTGLGTRLGNALGIAAFALIFGGAGLVALATPRNRRRR